jgi:hypothetical protein
MAEIRNAKENLERSGARVREVYGES